MNYNKTELEKLDQFLYLSYTLTIGELVLIAVSIIVLSTKAYIITENPLLHVNFMRLYKCVDEVFIEHGPLALIHSGIFGWLEIVRLGFGFMAGGCMIFFLIERVLATIMLKTYETRLNNGLSMLLIIMHIFVFSSFFVLILSGIISFTLVASMGILGMIVILITIFLLKYYNTRQYKRSKLENTHYTLSEEFQISENIRSLTILWHNFLVATGFITIIACLFVLSSFSEDNLLKRITFYAFNYMIVLFIIINSFIFIMSAYTWRRSLIKKLIWIKNCICPSKISSGEDLKFKNAQLNHLRTLDGQRMVYPINEEGELYFQQLSKNWARN